MAKRPSFSSGTLERVKVLIKKAKTASELKKIQCVLLGCNGMSAKDAAPLVGYHESYIWHFWAKFRIHGDKVFLMDNRLGNKNRAHLTKKEEKEFLKTFLDTAENGGVLIVKEVHEAFKTTFNRTVFPSVIYDLLHRHGWRKIAPRPSHPKANHEAQKAFKASFPPEHRGGVRKSKEVGKTSSSHVSG